MGRAPLIPLLVPLLVLMCGLPGSGKSTLASELARRSGALHWNKDALRELLFPAARVPHDRALNDACMELMYSAAREALGKRVSMVILDGRPFANEAQRERARAAAGEAGAAHVFVFCSAPMDELRRRVDAAHVAPDRNERLLERLAAEFEPFTEEPIRIDTSALSVGQAVEECLAGFAQRGLFATEMR